jgi:hypothetical protein
MFRTIVSVAAAMFCAGCVTAMPSPAGADDHAPPAGFETGTRVVKLMTIPGAPVVIDTAYVNLRNGADGKPVSVNASCVRYRNVAHENIRSVRFERNYFDASGHEVGSDAVDDATERAPDPGAVPGTGPVGDAYWVCTQTSLAYGPKVASVTISPVRVQFASSSVWRPQPNATR